MTTIVGQLTGLFVSWPGWASAPMTVTVGAGVDTWTPAGDIATLLDIAGDLETWLADGARPWSGVATFTGTADFSGPPRIVYRLDCSTACTYAPSTELQALLDWPASGQTSTAIYSTTGVPSGAAVTSDVRWPPAGQSSMGGYARSGAYCVEPQVVALRSSTAEMLADEQGVAVVDDALEGSSSTRWMLVYRRASGSFVRIYPDTIERPRATMPIYRYTIQGVSP